MEHEEGVISEIMSSETWQRMANQGMKLSTPFGVREATGRPRKATYSADIVHDGSRWRVYFDANEVPFAARKSPQDTPDLPVPPKYRSVGWLGPGPAPVGGRVVGNLSPSGMPTWGCDPTVPGSAPADDPDFKEVEKPVKKIYEMELDDYRRAIERLWK